MKSFCYSLVGGWMQNSSDWINRIPKAYISTPRGEVYSKHKTFLNLGDVKKLRIARKEEK